MVGAGKDLSALLGTPVKLCGPAKAVHVLLRAVLTLMMVNS